MGKQRRGHIGTYSKDINRLLLCEECFTSHMAGYGAGGILAAPIRSDWKLYGLEKKGKILYMPFLERSELREIADRNLATVHIPRWHQSLILLQQLFYRTKIRRQEEAVLYILVPLYRQSHSMEYGFDDETFL